MNNLQFYRKQINKIDQKIINLLKKRFEISKKIGIYKKAHGLPIQDKKREREILKKYSLTKGIDKNFIIKIFKLITSESKSVQGKTK